MFVVKVNVRKKGCEFRVHDGHVSADSRVSFGSDGLNITDLYPTWHRLPQRWSVVTSFPLGSLV